MAARTRSCSKTNNEERPKVPPRYIDFPVVMMISHRSAVPTLTNVAFVPPGMDTEIEATGIFFCNSPPLTKG